MLKILLLCILSVPGFICQYQPSKDQVKSKSVRFYKTDFNESTACFTVEMMATITLTNGTTKKWILNTDKMKPVNSVEGYCGTKEEYMIIPYTDNNITVWNLAIFTEKVVKNNKENYKLSRANLTLFTSNETSIEFINTGEDYEVPIDDYFRCKNQLSFDFTNSLDKNIKLTMLTTNLKIEAFRDINANYKVFEGPINNCPLDNVVNNIVPIIVGGILAGLVVLVLITYLIGRRHARSNYQTI